MDFHMAVMAKHESFSVSCSHNLRPDRFFFSALYVQIRKLTNVMYFHIFRTSAQFTLICKQAFYKFRPAAVNPIGSIIDNCVFLMC